MTTFQRLTTDLGLLLARVALGLILIMRGIGRLRDGGMAHQVALLTHQGVPSPQVFAWGTLLLELVGGALLILGLATPVVGAAVVAEMVMIICFFSWYRGFSAAHHGWEQHLALAALALVVTLAGPGRAALDHVLLGRRRTRSTRATGSTSVDQFPTA